MEDYWIVGYDILSVGMMVVVWGIWNTVGSFGRLNWMNEVVEDFLLGGELRYNVINVHFTPGRVKLDHGRMGEIHCW